MKIAFIITAAGSGTRISANKNKTLIKICGKTILEILLSRIINLENVNEIIITAKDSDIDKYNSIINLFPQKNIRIIKGGKTRQKSVLNALMKVNNENDFIFVHDAARPFLDKNVFAELVNVLKHCDFAAPVLKARDTLYELSNEVLKKLDREKIFAIQTPQCFTKELSDKIINFLSNTNKIYTDESSIALDMGIKPVFVDGSIFLNKITWSEDLKMAEAIFKSLI